MFIITVPIVCLILGAALACALYFINTRIVEVRTAQNNLYKQYGKRRIIGQIEEERIVHSDDYWKDEAEEQPTLTLSESLHLANKNFKANIEPAVQAMKNMAEIFTKGNKDQHVTLIKYIKREPDCIVDAMIYMAEWFAQENPLTDNVNSMGEYIDDEINSTEAEVIRSLDKSQLATVKRFCMSMALINDESFEAFQNELKTLNK